ncbi:hypothetical protein ACLOJK_027772 [Asimina triloba]
MTGRKIPSGQQEADDHDHDESQAAAAAAAEEARQARPHGFVDFLWWLLLCGKWTYEPEAVPVPEPRARAAEPQDHAGPATAAQCQEREGRSSRHAQGSGGSSRSGVRVEKIIELAVFKNAAASSAGSARDSGAVAGDITSTDRPSELRGDDDDEKGGLASKREKKEGREGGRRRRVVTILG